MNITEEVKRQFLPNRPMTVNSYVALKSRVAGVALVADAEVHALLCALEYVTRNGISEQQRIEVARIALTKSLYSKGSSSHLHEGEETEGEA